MLLRRRVFDALCVPLSVQKPNASKQPANHFLLIKTTATFAFFMGLCAAFLMAPTSALGQDGEATSSTSDTEKVSYARQVRPILAAKCFGCHQGNLERGSYDMTDFQRLLTGGDSGDPAVTPGDPDDSYLLEVIAIHEGKAAMPPEDEPIGKDDYEVIERWIAEGAENDYRSSRPVYSKQQPPVYSRQPFVTSLDVSPDGSLIGVTGNYEVLLLKSPTAEQKKANQPVTADIVHRLIGISSRIESIKFSPDGKRLAVAGGNPGEFGELQVWDVATGEMEFSKTVAHDSIFGVNWSPNGKLISFGCTDTTLRVIEADSGKQVLFQGAHDDWVRATVFSVDSKQLVSVGRDMSCKLIDVPTERFIDNITSITPGVLKGGIATVTRHPQRDEILIGGADGMPKLYRLNRLTKRVIGDDANLIRKFPKMSGRINSISISADGKKFAAASSLDGKGFLNFFKLDFDTAQPDDIKQIVSKVVTGQTAAEKKRLEEFVSGTPATAEQNLDTALYSIDFSADGTWLVAAGTDGRLRVFDADSGKQITELLPVVPETSANSSLVDHWNFSDRELPITAAAGESIEQEVVELRVSPLEIQFNRHTDYAQLVVQAKLADESYVDVTHVANYAVADSEIASARSSIVEAKSNGQTELVVSFGSFETAIPIQVAMGDAQFKPNFIRDVNPVLTKLGCNAGTCHGSQGGKKGFKLSLRGYDPLYDIRSFTDELGSRRVNVTSAEQSLMLMKPAAMVPHEGGQLIQSEDKYFSLIRKWIADGAQLDLETPRVSNIEILPNNPVLIQQDSLQQMRVIATFSDGSTADVTHEAVLEIGDIEIASVEGSRVTAIRRGEAAILARYEGSFSSTTLTVMGDRSGFEWKQPESWSPIDDLVAAKWQRLKITPSGICDDAEFLRRIYLDLTGLPPNAEQVESFLADETPVRQKRDKLIEALIGNEEFVEHWSNKWADLMQVNRKYLGTEGSVALRNWLRKQVRENRPYDEFAHEILTASGSNKDNPAASYFKIHRTPEDAMENTTHLFLATRFNCNKCHDHPFERWTQDQYYETAAFFAQINRAADPQAGDKKIGGSAVEGAKPLYELITDKKDGEVTHVRTGKTAKPKFPFEATYQVSTDASRRDKLAAWITSSDNPYFATSYVNRLWGYMMGVGLIEPLDDIRAGNPASNPELLEFLRKEFVDSNFDTRHVIRLICQSRTYQLSVDTNAFNDDDGTNFSHALARRLPAEVLFDSIHTVTGSVLNIPGVKAGTRAAALPDSGAKLPSGFLSTLGRPARESVCECERSNELQLGSVLAFVSGPDLAKAINDPQNAIAKMVAAEQDDRKLVDQIFLRVLNRSAKAEEIELALATLNEIKVDHASLEKQLETRREWFASEKVKLELNREQAVKAAQSQVDAAIKKHDAGLLKKEAERAQNIAVAQKAIDDYTASQATFSEWRQKQLHELQWHPLQVSEYASEVGRTATIRSDRSVLLSADKKGKDKGLASAKTDLTGVSYLRLEALVDPALPGQGPGLASNGNFVLSEFEVEMADPNHPDKWLKVPLASARADFHQQGFNANFAIDGKTDQKGWAVAPQVSKTHWAVFKLKTPIGYSQGTLLRFRFIQNFDDLHQLGCFRISLSRYAGDAGLGLSETLAAELATPVKRLLPKRKASFEAMAKSDDEKMAGLLKMLAAAKRPVKVHAAIAKARKKLARMERPVPDDSLLVELEKNFIQSKSQIENERLTAAQDLTWALINSPSFLFNR